MSMPTRTLTFTLAPKGPFTWSRSLDVLCNFAPTRRHGRRLEGGDGVTRVAFPLDGDFAPVGVALRWRDDARALEGEVVGVGSDRVDAAARQVARIFSLDHDATAYPAVGARDAKVLALMKSFAGLRPVCFTSPYETAAWAILSNRIARAQAARILEGFVAEHGRRLEVAGRTVHAFPEPERLGRVERIAGVAPVKVARLREVAAAAMDGALDAERLRALGDERGPASLRAIPGIGPFWSSGIYLRGCGIRDVFPDEPLSIAALGALHGLGDRPDAATVASLTDAYRPFRMWVCFLLRVAAARGAIAGIRERARRSRVA